MNYKQLGLKILFLGIILTGSLCAAENKLQYEIVPFDYNDEDMKEQLYAMVRNDKDIQHHAFLNEKCMIKILTEYIFEYNLTILVCRSVDKPSNVYGFLMSNPDVDMILREVHHLAVHKKYRQKGIAQAMLQALQIIAKEQGSDYMRISVDFDNYAAICAYRKFGFDFPNVLSDYMIKIIGS